MHFRSVVPILYAADINKSIEYYTRVLDFDDSWIWDDAASFGGVGKEAVRIYFCKGSQGNPGTWLAIDIEDVDSYYIKVKERGANIINPPQTFEWGMREMLVEDPDGHRIRFGQGVSIRQKSESALPDNIRIAERMATAGELHNLVVAVGWWQGNPSQNNSTPALVYAYTVVAENKESGEVVGCAFLLTDGEGMYYIKNVIVHPNWQGKQVGTAMMRKLDEWLNMNANNGTVFLHTGENLAPFYNQFGFTPYFSMHKKVISKDK
ncbi:MAG: GNAT family N-acetyltransferase [Agriterribacter sp.]